MGNCFPVSRNPGYSSRHGDLELLQIHSEAITSPLIQYPVDDTMPVKAWVFEIEKRPANLNRYKPLRPEDERKALEALNRHLPPWDQIEIPQKSLPGLDTAPQSKPRRYPETHLPLPPRCRNLREQLEAAESHRSPKTASSSKTLGKKPVKRARSKNWIQTDNQQEHESTEEMKDDLRTLVVPDLIVTRTDGEMRRLRDPNVYVGGE